MASPTPREDAVIGVPWNVFSQWFEATWRQGEHVAIVSPTGSGKSTLACNLALMRKWVVALDAKGGDETLGAASLDSVSDWPLPKRMTQSIAEGYPARVRVGFEPRKLEDFDALRALMAKTLNALWVDGRWTIIADEFQILTDRKMFNLGPICEKILVGARSKKVSFVSLYQAPAWVPTAATRQATWVFIYPTRDLAVIKSLADKIGRPWRELQSIIQNLPKYHFLCAGLDPLEPLIMSSCPKID